MVVLDDVYLINRTRLSINIALQLRSKRGRQAATNKSLQPVGELCLQTESCWRKTEFCTLLNDLKLFLGLDLMQQLINNLNQMLALLAALLEKQFRTVKEDCTVIITSRIKTMPAGPNVNLLAKLKVFS